MALGNMRLGGQFLKWENGPGKYAVGGQFLKWENGPRNEGFGLGVLWWTHQQAEGCAAQWGTSQIWPSVSRSRSSQMLQ